MRLLRHGPAIAWACLGVLSIAVLTARPCGATSAPAFRPGITLATGSAPATVVIGDFDRDGLGDFATTMPGGVSVLLATTDSTFAPRVDHVCAGTPWTVAAADVDGDGDLDLIASIESNGTISILKGDGHGAFGSRQDYDANGGARHVSVADVDRDGDVDLVVCNYGSGTVSVLKNDGNGAFGSPASFAAGGTYVIESEAADFDGDGDVDLAVADYSTTQVSILLGSGNGTFGAPTTVTVGSDPYSLAARDLDGDGAVDLAVADLSSSAVTVLYGNGAGGFGSRQDLTTTASPAWIEIGDMDGDTRPDIVVTASGSHPLQVFPGNRNRTFAARADYATGAPQSFALGDLDADGRLDVVTANIGQNTATVLRSKRPAAVASVLPSRGGRGAPVRVSLGGARFEPGATVKLALPGQPVVPGTSVSVAGDGLTMAATFDLGSPVLGFWDVVVTNPDSQTTTVAPGFEVAAVQQWTDPGGVQIPAPGVMREPLTVPDGDGGAVVVWQANRSGAGFDVYAQRLTSTGLPAADWPAGGVALCAHAGNQYPASIVSDGAGGAIVAWVDERDSLANGGNVFAQRVLGDGVVAWTADGVALGPNAAGQGGVVLASDGGGGCIAAWVDARLPKLVLYAQHADSSGARTWSNGVRVAPRDSWQYEPSIGSDGVGGAFVVWTDSLGATVEARVQRLDASGAALFGADGEALGAGDHPTIISNNGVVVWHRAGSMLLAKPGDRTSTVTDALLAQRVALDGALSWGSPVDVCDGPPGTRTHPTIISDLAGGAIVAWTDTRDGTADVYAQRLLANGATAWTVNGVAATTAAGEQNFPALATDGAGGAYVTWQDGRHADLDIYAQLLRPNGTRPAAWTADGIAVCEATGDQQSCVVVADGTGGIVAAWQDGRSDTTRVYANRVGADAEPVTGAPVERQVGPTWLRVVTVRPNPGRGPVVLELELARPAALRADVYDAAGRHVAVLARDLRVGAGRHALTWNGRDARGAQAAGGLYFVRVATAYGDVARCGVVRLR